MIIEDLNMYYAGAWAFDTKNARPVRIHRITTETSKQYAKISEKYQSHFVSFADAMKEPKLLAEVSFLEESPDRISTGHVSAGDLNLQWPSMGIINFEDGAYVISRVSQQSVIKCINHRTLRVHPVNPDLINLSRALRRPQEWRQLNYASVSSHKFLCQLYKPEYPDKEEALRRLLEDVWYSVALSPRIALSFIEKQNRLGVYLYGQLVGTYGVKDNTFKPMPTIDFSAKSIVYNDLKSLLECKI